MSYRHNIYQNIDPAKPFRATSSLSYNQLRHPILYVGITFSTVALFSISSQVNAVNITNIADIRNNSSLMSSGGRWLTSGANFTVQATTEINTGTLSVLKFDSVGNILTIDNRPNDVVLSLLKTKTFELGAGNLNVTGGDVGPSVALWVTDNFVLSGSGTVTTKGGTSLKEAHGIWSYNLQQNSGTINATGGDNYYASYGVHVEKTLTQDTGGIITANGGVAGAGVKVDKMITSGSVTATGGGSQAYGIRAAQGVTQNDGAILTNGGTHAGAHGIAVTQSNYAFTQNNGTLTSNGSNIAAAYGIGLLGAKALFTQNGGTTTANGGLGINALGIGLTGSTSATFTQNAGYLYANGGGGALSHGIALTSPVASFIQSGGDITAKGGLGLSSGISLSGASSIFTQNAGKTTSIGGGVLGAHGIALTGTNSLYQQQGGELVTTGGGLAASHGLALTGATSKMIQNAGKITASGGGILNAYGIALLGADSEFNQVDGMIEAQGGGAIDAHAIVVDGASRSVFTQSGGQIKATGGAGFASHGIVVRNISSNYTQEAGSIEAVGGTFGGKGIYVEGSFQQNNGVIKAQGGGIVGVNGSYGIGVASAFTQNGGTIEALGGSSTEAHGLALVGSAAQFTQNAGTINAFGGSNGAHGLAFTQANAQFNQTGGALSASGGSGNNAYGVNFANTGLFTQSGGSVVATGGTGANAYGMNFSVGADYTQSAENMLEVIGGSGANAYGINAAGTITINGRLQFSRTDTAASLYSTGILTLENGSTLAPVVDLSNANDNEAAGLIKHLGSNINLGGTVKLDPVFNNVSSQSIRFIEDASAIGYTFDYGGSLTLNAVAEVYSGDNKVYVLTLNRTSNPSDHLDGRAVGGNTLELIEAIENGGNPTNNENLDNFVDKLNSFGNVPDLVEYAVELNKNLTPHSAHRLVESSLRQNDVLIHHFFPRLREIRYPVAEQSKVGYATATPVLVASLVPMIPALDTRPSSRRMWLTPVYYRSSHIRAISNDFQDGNEWFAGLSFGAGVDIDHTLMLGVEFSHLRGKYRSFRNENNSDTYSFTFGGRLDRDQFSSGHSYNPWLEVSAGYAYGDFDQERTVEDSFNTLHQVKSSPTVNLFSAGLTVGTDIRVNNRLVVTPNLGVDYASIRTKAYSESGSSTLELSVAGETYKSLRPHMGLDAEVIATDNLKLIGRAKVRYETGDRNPVFRSEFVSTPGIRFYSRGDKRSAVSGNIGMAIRYQAAEHLELGASYDLGLEEGDKRHQFSLNASYAF